MKARTLMLMVVAAGATAAVAALVARRDTPDTQAASEHGRVLPALKERVNDVASIRVQRADGVYTLERKGERWGLADRGGYPVQMELVRKALLALAELEIVEPKTADPARHERLGVQDVDQAGAEGALVTLGDAAGAPIASLIVGKEAESKGTLLSGQVYVRRAGEAQSWLAAGRVDLQPEGTGWLVKEILKVPQDRVRSIEVRQGDGETLVVSRDAQETRDFTLLDVPEGKELTYPTAANTLGGLLEWVNLEDVKPAGEFEFPPESSALTRVETFDGLVVTVHTRELEGKAWASFSASYEAPAALGPDPAQPAPAQPEAAQTEPGGEDAPKSAGKTPDEVRREADEINARVGPWAYAISSYSRAQLAKKKSELLKDKAPPAAPPGGGEGAGKVVIPGHLPPEIQEQIKQHQESLGNEVEVAPPGDKPPGGGGNPAPPQR